MAKKKKFDKEFDFGSNQGLADFVNQVYKDYVSGGTISENDYKLIQKFGGMVADLESSSDDGSRNLGAALRNFMGRDNKLMTLNQLAKKSAADQARANMIGAYDLSRGVGNIAQAGIDIGESVRQRRASREALENLPELYERGEYTTNPLLDAQIQQSASMANNSLMSPEARLMRRQIQDAEEAQLEQARIASGGQAGSYGSMAQKAALDAGKRDLEASAQMARMRQAEQQRLSQLTGQKMSEEKYIDAARERRYQEQLARRREEEIAAGQLGSQSRTNLMNSRRNLQEGLNTISPYLASKPTADMVSPTMQTGFGYYNPNRAGIDTNTDEGTNSAYMQYMGNPMAYLNAQGMMQQQQYVQPQQYSPTANLVQQGYNYQFNPGMGYMQPMQMPQQPIVPYQVSQYYNPLMM